MPSPAKKQRTVMISHGSTDTERTKKPPVLKQRPEDDREAGADEQAAAGRGHGRAPVSPDPCRDSGPGGGMVARRAVQRLRADDVGVGLWHGAA